MNYLEVSDNEKIFGHIDTHISGSHGILKAGSERTMLFIVYLLKKAYHVMLFNYA